MSSRTNKPIHPIRQSHIKDKILEQYPQLVTTDVIEDVLEEFVNPYTGDKWVKVKLKMAKGDSCAEN